MASELAAQKYADMKQMAERLCLLLKDEHWRRTMGLNAKLSLKGDFTISNMLKDTQGLYEGLINSGLRTPGQN